MFAGSIFDRVATSSPVRFAPSAFCFSASATPSSSFSSALLAPLYLELEEPEVIAKILAHLEKTAPDQHQAELPFGARAPPSQARLL